MDELDHPGLLMKNFRSLLAISILLFTGYELCAQQASTPDGAKILALRAKLNGVWTVDGEKTKEAWGFKDEPLPPFLQGTLEGYRSNTFEFRPKFIIMNYAAGGSYVSDQSAKTYASTNGTDFLLFERNEKLTPEFLGVVFTSTNTILLIHDLTMSALCITRNAHATIAPYGQAFEMIVRSTYRDTTSTSNRIAFKNRLDSALKAAKLGLLIDARHELPQKNSTAVSEDALSLLEKLDSATDESALLKSKSVAPDAPASHVYRLELYDFTKNRETLGSVLKGLGCPEDSELKSLAPGPVTIVKLEELLKKK